MESSPYVFRPISDSPCPDGQPLRNSVISSPISPRYKFYGCWRTNPEVRSRPGSSATNSRPPSTVNSQQLYCKSSNNSLTDVTVSRNFQQLTVSNRRSVFKGQKWSSVESNANSGKQPSKKRPGNSLDSENTGSSNDLKVEDRKELYSPVEKAKRELSELILRTEKSEKSVLKSTSLPSFPESFRSFVPKPSSNDRNIEEQLDDEIKMIVAKAERSKALEDNRRKQQGYPKEKSTAMHLEALMQLPYLSDAISPSDQIVSASPICSAEDSLKFQFPPPPPQHIPSSQIPVKEEEWNPEYMQYFAPEPFQPLSGGQQQQHPQRSQQHQQQQIMSTLDEAFFNSCNGNFDYNLDPYPSPPRSGFSSPANTGTTTTTDYASSSYDPLYFIPTEDVTPASSYDYYPLTKSDPNMGCCGERPMEDICGSMSELPGSPDSPIKEELLEHPHEDTGVYACLWIDCGEEFANQEKLVDHVNGVHMETKKGCEELPCLWKDCPRQLKPFNAKYKLLTHMRVHTREKPYKCNYENCDRAFARLENKKIHFRSHTGQKPFNCKFSKEFNCTKKFSNSSDRAKHEQTHKDPKPYRCEVTGCCKRYTDPSSLRKHVKSHSQEEQAQYRKSKDLANAAKRTASPSSKIFGPPSPVSWTGSVASSLPSDAIMMDSSKGYHPQHGLHATNHMEDPLFNKYGSPAQMSNPGQQLIPSDTIMYTTTSSVAQTIIRRNEPMEDMKCHSFDPMSIRYDHPDCAYDLSSPNWCS